MGSIEIKYDMDDDGNVTRGPYAYYVYREKGKKKRKWMGKVPRYYISLFNPEVRKIAQQMNKY